MATDRVADRTRKLTRVVFHIQNRWTEDDYEVHWKSEILDGEVYTRFWLVHGADHDQWYRVEAVGDKVTCTCPDKVGHDLPGGCKHAGALRYFHGLLCNLFRGEDTQ